MKELTVQASIDNVTQVIDFVNDQLKGLDCPKKTRIQINIAIDELFSNIAYYAYEPDTGSATIQVETTEDPSSVRISFSDTGKPYNPLEAEDPDITASADDRKIGGLGVFLVKKTMDDVSYEYRDGHNVLSIRKNLG